MCHGHRQDLGDGSGKRDLAAVRRVERTPGFGPDVNAPVPPIPAYGRKATNHLAFNWCG